MEKKSGTRVTIENGKGIGFTKTETLWVKPEDVDKVYIEDEYESHYPVWERSVSIFVETGADVYKAVEYETEDYHEVEITKVISPDSSINVYYKSSDYLTDEMSGEEIDAMWKKYHDIIDRYASAGYKPMS